VTLRNACEAYTDPISSSLQPPTHIRTPPSKSPLKVWPILAILGLGTYLFNQIVEQRKGEGYQPKGPIQGHSPSGKGQVKPSHPH